jgi:C1A family cysteine protease
MILASNGIKKHFSRLYLYYMTRKMQNRVGKPGAELKDTMTALSIYGSPEENVWPFMPGRTNVAPAPHAIEAAVHNKLREYEALQTTDFNSYIDNDIPVIIGMRTGRMFWEMKGPLETHAYKPVNNIDNRNIFGHAVTIIGYDNNLKGGSWIIANSRGPDWGFQGYGAIPYACEVDIGEAYIIKNFAGNMAGKKISKI